MREFPLTVSCILIQNKDTRVPRSEPGGSTGLVSPHMKKCLITIYKIDYLLFTYCLLLQKTKSFIGK